MSVSRRDQARNFILGVIIYSVLEKLWWLANLPARLIIRQFRLRFLEGFLGTTMLTLFLFAAVTSIWSAGTNAVDAGKRAFEEMFGGGEQRPVVSEPATPVRAEQQPALESAQAPTSTTTGVPELAGVYYSDFVQTPEGARFAISNLVSDPALAARFEDATATQSLSKVLKKDTGGSVLLFEGCKRHECLSARGLLAIDTRTGEVFVGMIEGDETTIVVPNLRVEAVLHRASGVGSWSSDRASFEGA